MKTVAQSADGYRIGLHMAALETLSLETILTTTSYKRTRKIMRITKAKVTASKYLILLVSQHCTIPTIAVKGGLKK